MNFEMIVGNASEALKSIADTSIQCCITSPPYFNLRDYGSDKQLGQETTPDEYIDNLLKVFNSVYRVLKNDGTLWINIGDTYASKKYSSIKPKDLIGIPWLLAFALRNNGWYLRSEIIWHKRNPMPESVKDRPTRAHEQLFLFTKSSKYYYDANAILEPYQNGGEWIGRSDNHDRIKGGGNLSRNDLGTRPVTGNPNGRNCRSVWILSSEHYKDAHFAVMPTKLVEPCILAGSKEGDTILDPFCGSGTVGVVAFKYNRNFIGIDINSEYIDLAIERINNEQRNADKSR